MQQGNFYCKIGEQSAEGLSFGPDLEDAWEGEFNKAKRYYVLDAVHLFTSCISRIASRVRHEATDAS